MAEERLKLAVFIDYDNIQIGVKDTLGKEFDVALVLEALKERGEVVTKVAYGDWHRAGEQSRQMTQHAVQMVQRNVTPRGDKNGADINLALDALEMAFTRHHINGFAIVGGDSDFIALVEKLKQYDKKVFVVGGREFTSNILQRNCTEFVAYEHLLKPPSGGDGGRASRSRRGEHARAALETRPLSEALTNIQRALQILADRGVAPQLGLLKSTLLQLDSTFSERDYGAGSFLEFMQKMERERLAHLRRTDRGFLVELPADGEPRPPAAEAETRAEAESAEGAPVPTATATEVTGTSADA
ncbi:MAG TPA: NYN domain-containing protein, partial [Terriglobia bacterium]|nr:NYN domain-containing protein [Terriglobia bacterium]